MGQFDVMNDVSTETPQRSPGKRRSGLKLSAAIDRITEALKRLATSPFDEDVPTADCLEDARSPIELTIQKGYWLPPH